MSEQKNIQFAIVGCGKIAWRHAAEITKIGKIDAVCDIVEKHAFAISEKFGGTIFNDYNKLLSQSNADLISICTPNGLHAQHTIAALENGFHVLCEKPMAISSKDCKAMIDAAKAANKKLFIVKQNRYNPPVQAVKKLLLNKTLGNIYSFQLNCFWNRDNNYYTNSWKGTLAHDGGTLYTQFSHFIDLLYWFFGDVQHISAQLNNFAHQGIIEFEDTGQVLFQFRNGIEGALNYTVNAHNKNMEGSLSIFGEKGTVKIGGQYLNELEYQNIDGYTINDLPLGKGANEYGNYSGSMSNHDMVYQNILEVLQHNAPIFTTAEDGLKTVEIIEEIYKFRKK